MNRYEQLCEEYDSLKESNDLYVTEWRDFVNESARLSGRPLPDQDMWPPMLPALSDFMTRNNGNDFLEMNQGHLKSTWQKSGLNKYLITFTHNNEHDKSSFSSAVIKQLNRAVFSSVLYAFEHQETNLHCHAICESRFKLDKSHFKSHIKKHGSVDIATVKKDNGLEEYISKESTPIRLK